MRDPTSTARTAEVALTKLSVALLFLIILTAACFFTNDQTMRGMAAVLLLVLVLPINILCCIDASRAIASQAYVSRRKKILGAVLGVPQVILGAALIAIGFIYPFIGFHNLYRDLSAGHSVSQDLLWIFISLVMLGLGYFYLKESLWLVLGRRGFKSKSTNESTKLP